MPLGHATFHLTFFSGPISTGGCCPSATPDPFGPRNCGHGEPSAARVVETTTSTTRQASVRILYFPCDEKSGRVPSRLFYRPRSSREQPTRRAMLLVLTGRRRRP